MEERIQVFDVDFLTKLHRHDSYIFIQSPLQGANPTAANAAKQKSHASVVKNKEDVRRPHLARLCRSVCGCIWANNFYNFTYFLFVRYFVFVNKAIAFIRIVLA